MRRGRLAPISRSSTARLAMRCIRPRARHVTRASCRSRTAPREPAEATFREGGINCEMCHGPSLDHVERAEERRQSRGQRRDNPSQFSARLPAERYVAVCAQCHAQSAVHDAQAGGAVNYSATGDPFRTYLDRASVGLLAQGVLSRRPLPRDDVHQRSVCAIAVFSQRRTRRAGRATIRIRRMRRRIRTR